MPHEAKKASLAALFLDGFLLILFVSFLWIGPWFYGLTNFRDQLFSQILIFATVLIPLLFYRPSSFSWFRAAGLDGWILLSLTVSLFYVPFSILSYQSLLAFLRLASCVLFYGMIRSVLTTERRLQFVFWMILLAGLFYAGYGLFQYYGFIPHAYWYQPNSLSSRYVNSGHFGTLLLFPLFIAFSLLVSTQKKVLQLVLAAILLVLGWTLLLSRARAVWLGFAVGAVLFVWLGWSRQLFQRKTFLGLLVFGAGIILLLWAKGGLTGIILKRFEELWQSDRIIFIRQSGRFYSLLYRQKLWEAALGAIADRPWGWGLGTFSTVFPQYRVHFDRFFVDYAHNEFLQVGVDLGVVGIFLLTGFLFVYFRKAFSFLRSRQVNTIHKIQGAGLLALMVSLVLASQVDFPLRIYGTSLFFAAFLALSTYFFSLAETRHVVIPSSRGGGMRSQGNFFRWISVATVLVCGVYATKQFFAQIDFERGARFEKDFSWQKAEDHYEKAARLAPHYANYHEALGSLYRKESALAFNHDKKEKLLDQAIQSYERAVELNPYQAARHYSLALLYEEKGELKKAKSELIQAISLEPSNSFFLSEYGYFALRHSWTEEALSAFEKLKEIPFQEGRRDGTLSDFLMHCYEATDDYHKLQRLILDNPEGHFNLGWVLGTKGRWDLAKKEFDRARELAHRSQPYEAYMDNVGRPLVQFYISHKRFREAIEVYREAVRLNPGDTQVQVKLEELSRQVAVTNTLGLPQ